ncbi:MAG: transporter ATP-binding protein [Caulobacteraceae bacterium]|jgi:zinc/manganese transport system ATP-binding protein|nr:transporter ATP-binding protein [Caulobacteraceae bacterium]
MAGVKLHNLSVGYDRHPAVQRLTGAFAPDTLTAVVGPNGSGKSTLLKALAGHARPLAGEIDLCGVRPAEIAYLPQAHGLDLKFPLSLGDLVGFGLIGRRGLFGGLRTEDRDRLAEVMAQVGLQGLERRPIGSVSGGQLQRALFARVMAQDAKLVLLDEPFNGIDARAAEDLAQLMANWPAQGRTVIAVLHDLDLVRRLCPQSLVLAREAVAWGPTDTTVSPERLIEARRLAESWNTADEPPVSARPMESV